MTTPAGRAPAWFSSTVPSWMARSPVKVPAVALSPPRINVPWPALMSAPLAPTPVVRLVPLWVIVPIRFKVPAPALAVLVVARMTPVPSEMEPSAPNQPVPKLPLLPLTTLRMALLPTTNENVPAPWAPAALI